jgi:F-type H+-transporting ATPase subunit gamma
MANTREILKRRKSVQNICKITSTMELIATARFKKAFDRAVSTRPYNVKISELVSSLSSNAGDVQHPLMAVNTASKKTLIVVMTSNRGLCGGYNGSVIRMAAKAVDASESDGQLVDLRVSGKKGAAFFKFTKREMAQTYNQFDEKLTYAQVDELATEIIDLYLAGKIDTVKIVYTKFESSARYGANTLNLLPLADLESTASDGGETTSGNDDYIYSPSAGEILDELIPTTVRMSIFQCFLDAVVSEQVARMSAMKAATDSANEMIGSLGRLYNRARQAQVTNELLDIMGGVEALK